jgi:hypothetical protein
MSEAKECARNSNIPFQSSHGCCEKFMKGESLLQLRIKISQKLSLEFETKLIILQCFVIGLHRRNKYSLSQIGNGDKTAVFSTCVTIISSISKVNMLLSCFV